MRVCGPRLFARFAPDGNMSGSNAFHAHESSQPMHEHQIDDLLLLFLDAGHLI